MERLGRTGFASFPAGRHPPARLPCAFHPGKPVRQFHGRTRSRHHFTERDQCQPDHRLVKPDNSWIDKQPDRGCTAAIPVRFYPKYLGRIHLALLLEWVAFP